jgi:hypothetical protein
VSFGKNRFVGRNPAVRTNGARDRKHFPALVVTGVVVALLAVSAATGSTGLPPSTVVFELDTTISVTEHLRSIAKAAVADAVYKRAKGPHGAIAVYARVINHTSGTDSAARFSDVIPASGPIPNCEAFDPQCFQDWAKEHNTSLDRARAVRRRINELAYRVTSDGTAVRGAIAAGAEILEAQRGERWLVLASDLKPSNAEAPAPHIRLDGVHVDVILACDDALATCQGRRKAWEAELDQRGAGSVAFFSIQQAAQVMTR